MAFHCVGSWGSKPCHEIGKIDVYNELDKMNGLQKNWKTHLLTNSTQVCLKHLADEKKSQFFGPEFHH